MKITMITVTDLCIALLVYAFISVVHAEDECVMRSACLCVFPNGTGFDITPTALNGFYKAQTYVEKPKEELYELNTYYFQPCLDNVMNDTIKNETNTCDKPLSICRHVYNMKQNTTTQEFTKSPGSYDYLGSNNETKFSPDGRSIVYLHGPSNSSKAIEVRMQLVCAQMNDTLFITDLSEPNNLTLSFFSRYACLRQIEEVGRSVGSTLLIVFFSFLIFYLVLGIGTKKFLMGATGIEVIPNLAFWSALPSLVKDGWVFAMSGFKVPARGSAPAATPDPRSYESI